MPIYVFESRRGKCIEDIFPIGKAPKMLKRDGVNFYRVVGGLGGFSMPRESSPMYQKWFHSNEVQAKLKSGEYVIDSKSSDCAHR